MWTLSYIMTLVMSVVFLMLAANVQSAECRADFDALSTSHLASAAAPLQVEAERFVTGAQSEFGPKIEAAAVDKSGSIFATDFSGTTSKLGEVASGTDEVAQTLFFGDSSGASFFNGLRFLQSGGDVKVRALAADVNGHRVVMLSKNCDGVLTASVFCQDSRMVQPNDIAIAPRSGRVYTSGQNFTANTVVGDGDLWVCQAPGFQSSGPVEAVRLGIFGRTNGIEVSPDEKTLYLSEAFNKDNAVVSNVVWKFPIDPSTGNVGQKTLFVDFQQLDGSGAVDVDGMRTDVEGNLFITRNNGGEVVKFSPEGEVLLRLRLPGTHTPTNLDLGGLNGTSLFVVGTCVDAPGKGCVDVWHGNPVPGRAFDYLNNYS